MDESTRFQVRVPADLHAKARVIAALRGDSLNGTVVEAIRRLVEDWEKKHGELPMPPEGE